MKILIAYIFSHWRQFFETIKRYLSFKKSLSPLFEREIGASFEQALFIDYVRKLANK
jgi:hypothetical protein